MQAARRDGETAGSRDACQTTVIAATEAAAISTSDRVMPEAASALDPWCAAKPAIAMQASTSQPDTRSNHDASAARSGLAGSWF